MDNQTALEREEMRVREIIDTIASEEVKKLIDELELIVCTRNNIEWRKKYENIG